MTLGLFRFGLALFLISSLSLPARSMICQQATLPPGTSASSSIDKAFNFKEEAVTDKDRSALQNLCWTFDEKTGLIKNSSGEPLSSFQYQSFMSPYDNKKYPLTPAERETLYSDNCRFKGNGMILRKGETGEYSALRNIDILEFQKIASLHDSQLLIGNLSDLISKQNPNQPLSDEVIHQIQVLIENVAGSKTPPFLAQALRLNQKIPAGQIGESLKNSALEFEKFFDGPQFQSFYDSLYDPQLQSSYDSLWRSAKSVDSHGGEWLSKGYQSYFNGSEFQVGRMIQKDVARVLSQNQVGREILNHFKVGSQFRLPAFLIGEAGPFAAAYSLPGRNTLVFNQDLVMETILFNINDPKSKIKVKEILSKPGALNAYLASHPKDLNAVVSAWDTTIAHELTHAWQDRRMSLGTYAPGDPLEMEYEAFTWENRYLLADIIAHPNSSLNNPKHLDDFYWLSDMLKDYQLFTEHIRHEYEQGDSVNVASLKDIKDTEKEEEFQSLHQIFSSPSPVKSLLKIFGLYKAQKATGNYQRDWDKRREDFLAHQYPQMRQDARNIFTKIAKKLMETNHKKASGERYHGDIDIALQLAQATGDVRLTHDIERARDNAYRNEINRFVEKAKRDPIYLKINKEYLLWALKTARKELKDKYLVRRLSTLLNQKTAHAH